LQSRFHPLLELLEQQRDDLVLIAEVVVKIAGADVLLIGDMVSGNARFAAFVEKLQAGLQDAVTGFHGASAGSDERQESMPFSF